MDLTTALASLETQDYFIWDDFLSSAEVAIVASDCERLYLQGSFELGGIGKQKTSHHRNELIRSDETYWLNPLDLSEPQSLFWDRLENLKREINTRFFLGLWSLDGHYSRYPINGHYQKHLDRFQSDDRRTISMILYLNPVWREGDGGELRFHLPAEEQKTFDVAPIGGRLVCFLSSKVLHEVLVTQKVRLSFAGWWTRRAL